MNIIFRTTTYRLFLDSDAPVGRRTAPTNDLAPQSGPGVVLAISPYCANKRFRPPKETMGRLSDLPVQVILACPKNNFTDNQFKLFIVDFCCLSRPRKSEAPRFFFNRFGGTPEGITIIRCVSDEPRLLVFDESRLS